MKKFVNELSSAGISATTDTEPDFGNWLAGGKVRKLGAEMSGKADAWFLNGGYEQTDFPMADDMWGKKFNDLTVFNMDPGIYRKSAGMLMKVPPSWSVHADAKSAEVPDAPNTVPDGEFESPSDELVDGNNIEVPKYTDFFN